MTFSGTHVRTARTGSYAPVNVWNLSMRRMLSAAVNVFLYFTLNKFKSTLKYS